MAQKSGPQSEGDNIVFVYGTLKRSFPNHYFLQEARFLGMARTLESYALYVEEFPLVCDEPVSPIVGEVYSVSDRDLARLDGLQKHPDWFMRRQVPVKLKSGKELKAWMYFYPERHGRLLSEGEYDGTIQFC